MRSQILGNYGTILSSHQGIEQCHSVEPVGVKKKNNKKKIGKLREGEAMLILPDSIPRHQLIRNRTEAFCTVLASPALGFL